MRNLFRAGPLLEAADTGVSGEDEVRFSGVEASASEVVRGEPLSSLGGSAGSTTAVVAGGGEAAGRGGHERSSGCIWHSTSILVGSCESLSIREREMLNHSLVHCHGDARKTINNPAGDSLLSTLRNKQQLFMRLQCQWTMWAHSTPPTPYPGSGYVV